MAFTYGYQKDTDYRKLMEEAVAAGDYARAAIYEAQRNEKILGEGLTKYQQTNQYASYLPGSAVQGWQNPYKADLDKAIAGATDAGAYAKQYLREADRTQRDTLAQYSMMTGGLPSAQAVTAASQAADYTKSQLPEKLADLNRQNASLLLSASGQAQSEYQAMISQALTRWNQLGYADETVSQILGVGVGTPTSDQSYRTWQQAQQEKSDAYTMGQQEKSNAYTLAMTLLQMGQMPAQETLAKAGISQAEAQSVVNAYNAALSTKSSGGSSGGGSSSSSSPKKGDNTEGKSLTATQWNNLEKLYKEAVNSGNFDAYNTEVSKLKTQGYDVSKADAWARETYGEPIVYGSGVDGFSNIWRTIKEHLKLGNTEKVWEMIEMYDGQYTESQWKDIVKLLKEKGLWVE